MGIMIEREREMGEAIRRARMSEREDRCSPKVKDLAAGAKQSTEQPGEARNQRNILMRECSDEHGLPLYHMECPNCGNSYGLIVYNHDIHVEEGEGNGMGISRQNEYSIRCMRCELRFKLRMGILS